MTARFNNTPDNGVSRRFVAKNLSQGSKVVLLRDFFASLSRKFGPSCEIFDLIPTLEIRSKLEGPEFRAKSDFACERVWCLLRPN